jgi:hypothetical protein
MRARLPSKRCEGSLLYPSSAAIVIIALRGVDAGDGAATNS